jgi:hypothetical protein
MVDWDYLVEIEEPREEGGFEKVVLLELAAEKEGIQEEGVRKGNQEGEVEKSLQKEVENKESH